MAKIILLHGWGVNSQVWQPIIDSLEQQNIGLDIIALDLPGHGQAPLILDASLEDWIKAIAEQIKIPSIIIGWSLGGLVSLGIAHYYPDKVKALAMVAANPCFIKQANWPGMEAKVFNSFIDNLAENFEETWRKFLNLQFLRLPKARQLAKQLEEKVIIQGLANPVALEQGLRFLQLDHRDWLASLSKSIPIYLVLGQLDALVPMAVGEKFKTISPLANIEILETAGHGLLLTHTEKMIGLIQSLYAESIR